MHLLALMLCVMWLPAPLLESSSSPPSQPRLTCARDSSRKITCFLHSSVDSFSTMSFSAHTCAMKCICSSGFLQSWDQWPVFPHLRQVLQSRGRGTSPPSSSALVACRGALLRHHGPTTPRIILWAATRACELPTRLAGLHQPSSSSPWQQPPRRR